APSSRLFGTQLQSVYSTFANEPVTQNLHHMGVDPASFDSEWLALRASAACKSLTPLAANPHLASFWHILATNNNSGTRSLTRSANDESDLFLQPVKCSSRRRRASSTRSMQRSSTPSATSSSGTFSRPSWTTRATPSAQCSLLPTSLST